MTPEVEKIKDAIRSARTVAELDHVKNTYRARVQEMSDSPTLHVMGIQIRNLAAWKRKELERDDV